MQLTSTSICKTNVALVSIKIRVFSSKFPTPGLTVTKILLYLATYYYIEVVYQFSPDGNSSVSLKLPVPFSNMMCISLLTVYAFISKKNPSE